MKKPLLILIALICAIAGCKIDEAGIPKKQSNQLLNGKWFLKASIATDPTTGATDLESYYTAKDYYVFNNDNSLNYSSSFPDTTINTRYSYTNSSSGQHIFIGEGSDITNITINKLTADSLIILTSIDASISGSITVTSGSGTTGTSSSASISIPVTYKLARK